MKFEVSKELIAQEYRSRKLLEKIIEITKKGVKNEA